MRFLTAVLVTFALVLGPSAAEAKGSPGCITKKEFGQIATGMTEAKVRRIVGSDGLVVASMSFSDGDASETLEFVQCRSWRQPATVHVIFEYSEWTVQAPCPEDSCVGYYPQWHYSAPFGVVAKYAFRTYGA